MTRQTASPPGPQLNEDELYQGVLVTAKIVPSKQEGWGDQLELDWELKQGAKLRDYVSVRIGISAAGAPSKLRTLLNALANKPKDAELWFDQDSLEWGYDMAPKSAPYLKLQAGLAVAFRGELKPDKQGVKRYRIATYRPLP